MVPYTATTNERGLCSQHSAMSANRNTFEAQSEFGGELPKKEILTAKADKIQDLALEGCI
jgi:hypothetical protein